MSDGTQRIVGVVGVLERGNTLLMVQRSEAVRAAGMWCFPGGTIEPGESPADAIVREFYEEVGLTVQAVAKLWEWDRPDGGLHLFWWQVRLITGEIRLAPAEVQAYAWMTDAQIRSHERMIPNNIAFLDHYRRTIRG